MMIATRTSLLSQSAVATPGPSVTDWNFVDAEFRTVLLPVHLRLSSGEISPGESGNTFSILLKAHLERFEVSDQPESSQALTHRSRRVEKLAENLRKEKNMSGRLFKQNPSRFHNINRLYSKAVKAKANLSSNQMLRKNKSAFRKNPWQYAKSVCEPKSHQEPSCPKKAVYNHFFSTCAPNNHYQELPSWIAEVMPISDENSLSEFDLSPITPSLIKGILRSRSSGSSPGDDDISYHHLKKMPCTHHFLATLFSKILLESHPPPSAWCCARIKLIHKGGDTSKPANFRPIALTSVVGKLLNKIIATRLEEFLLENKIINPSLQKGFLSGINGTMEHIFSLSAIIDNARQNKLPLALTFIDLRNAFGSVSHTYIKDILEYVKLPNEVQFYVSTLYANLSAYIATKQWKTSCFKIGRGVFQGDTLSPLIFLLAFNPIIQAIFKLESGFKLKLPTPTCSEKPLPNVGTYIYAYWVEEESSEQSGWYLTKILSAQPNGSVTLKYRKGNTTENTNLNSIQWIAASGRGKWFLPPSLTPQMLNSTAASQPNFSSPHRVKGFADDLTVFSSSKEEHESTLSDVDSKCKDLDLTIRADKCVSMVFDGNEVKKKATFRVGDGVTRNITDGATKFLGSVLAASQQGTKTQAGKILLEAFSEKLSNLDKAQIRGEYKLWIYKRYLTQSIRFFLSVNPIPSTYIS